jgi:hypothetical protein
MPSGISEQVAADHSATAETPVEGTNALGVAKCVEEFHPPTAEPGAAVSRNWVELSEDIPLSVPSTGNQQPAEAGQSQGSSTEVKEEYQKARSTSEVPLAGRLSVEVAGDNAATEGVAADITCPKFLDWKAPKTVWDTSNRKKTNSHFIHPLLG